MNVGDTIYIKESESSWIHRWNFVGETSRSWLVGATWNPTKYAKNKTVFVTEADFNEQIWANKNRHKISTEVSHYKVTPEQLRKIAEIIGYKEEGAE
jgi:hypothetical protein